MFLKGIAEEFSGKEFTTKDLIEFITGSQETCPVFSVEPKQDKDVSVEFVSELDNKNNSDTDLIEPLCKDMLSLDLESKPIKENKNNGGKDLIESLCNEIVGENIKLNVYFMGEYIDITNCNPIGDIMEDIVFNYLKNKVNIREGPPQKSPDYYIDDSEYELKTFKGSPNFDISNYVSFINQLSQTNGVYRKLFNTKYIIFEYEEKNDKFCIVSFHYKRLWEILSYDKTYPISIQNKKNIWYNIRPGSIKTWDDKNKNPNMCIKYIIESIIRCPNIDNKEIKINNIKQQWEDIKILHLELNLQPLE
jgi:hypothetical protein